MITQARRDKDKRYLAAHRDEINARRRARAWRPTERARRRDAYKRKYGITIEAYDELFQKQNGLCRICGQPEMVGRYGVIQNLTVDHAHDTGRVRGLLCFKCNLVLGMAGDDSQILARAILYLRGEL